MTPDDTLAIVNREPALFDEADLIHVSVSFTWDIPRAEFLAKQWEMVAPVQINGPAYGTPGHEFTPGMYVKRGCVITSRGCPNKCWFCSVWKREGTIIRELTIHEGNNILDDNILATSIEHQIKVFEMLLRQPESPIFSGGLEAARLKDWHIDWLLKLKPKRLWFAYDTHSDYEPLVQAVKLLKEAGLINKSNSIGCYVLCGWATDSIQNADKRCLKVAKLGLFPQAMLFNRGELHKGSELINWRKFTREWANKTIVGAKIKKLHALYAALEEGK